MELSPLDHQEIYVAVRPHFTTSSRSEHDDFLRTGYLDDPLYDRPQGLLIQYVVRSHVSLVNLHPVLQQGAPLSRNRISKTTFLFRSPFPPTRIAIAS